MNPCETLQPLSPDTAIVYGPLQEDTINTTGNTFTLVSSTPEIKDMAVDSEARKSLRTRIEKRIMLRTRLESLKISGKHLHSAMKEDWSEKESKIGLLMALGCYASTKTVGRLHLPSTVMSNVSMQVYSSTHNAATTAMTATALTFIWSRTATGAMNHAVNHSPKTFIAANKLPLVSAYSSSYPGLRSYVVQSEENEERRSSTLQRFTTHMRRGAVATNRLTAYITAAGREGHTYEERKKLAWALSFDASMIKGVMFAGIAEAISAASKNNQELAQTMENGVKHPLLWPTIGGIIMGSECAKNFIRKRKNRNS